MKKNETNFAIQDLAEKDQKDYVLNANFTIVDKTNNPISGVTVATDTKSVTTTIKGIAKIHGLKNKQTTVTISKTGYTSKTVTIVKDAQEQTFTVTLEKTTKTIDVTVTDGSSGIENANVTLIDSSDNTSSFTATTDNSGEASVTDIPIGWYNATVSADGYMTLNSSVLITSTTESCRFDLTAIPVPTPQVYSFVSYDDNVGTTVWGEGTAEITQDSNGEFVGITVLTNSTDQSFVGQKFYIAAAAIADDTTIYPLFLDLSGHLANIYVKVSQQSEEE